jgi:hypothetical protein
MPTRLPAHRSADLIWLLRVDLGGTPHYLSTEQISLSRDDGTVIAYDGGLTEPQYSESLSRFSYTRDALTQPIEAVFSGLDMAEHRRRGFFLSTAQCELSIVFRVNGVIQETYEGRHLIIKGWMSEPLFGHPDRPPGYVVFSINSNPHDLAGTFIDSTMRINSQSMTNFISIHNPLSSESEDKVYPLVFGTPGVYSDENQTLSNARGTPGYAISRTNVSQHANEVLIAGHHVAASTVRIHATGNGAISGLTVTNGFDYYRNPIAYVDVTSQPNSFRSAEEFWITFNDGAGVRNPFATSGVVNGAGDLMLWACTEADFEVDHGAWYAARDYLNAFKFSGYINDPAVTIWQWMTEIAKFIPTLTIRNGPHGIYPIIQDLRSNVSSAIAITAGPDFYRTGPLSLEGDQGEIINTVSIDFAFNGKNNVPQNYTVIGEPDPDEPQRFSTTHSMLSINRYGVRETAIEAPFIYDKSTAQLVAEAIVQTQGQIPETVEYQASIYYSFLNLGDQVALTDEDIYLTDQICTVAGRSWDSNGWKIRLLIEDDPIRDPRYT